MLSQKLKELKLNKKLSQVALSEKLGISNGLYNKYEKRPPTLHGRSHFTSPP